MDRTDFGRLLAGQEDDLLTAYRQFQQQPIDWDWDGDQTPPPRRTRTTLAEPVTVSGHGTFQGRTQTTITLTPTSKPGWRFDRTDLGDCLPVRVSAENVWTTGDIVSNIVLRSGPPSNYIRMVEHIIALRLGLDVDDLLIRIDSGDPPLFDRGSLDLQEALAQGGRREQSGRVSYVTVKEKVSLVDSFGRLLILTPAESADDGLTLDCAIDFPNVIGQQRIRFPLNEQTFRIGVEARTNTPFLKMLFCRTVGKLFADVRNLGYTYQNILVAGKTRYVNEAGLVHGGRSLEAVWHRAVLDLVAALALIEEGRFVGHVESYKAGHRLDVDLVRRLYQEDLLVTL